MHDVMMPVLNQISLCMCVQSTSSTTLAANSALVAGSACGATLVSSPALVAGSAWAPPWSPVLLWSLALPAAPPWSPVPLWSLALPAPPWPPALPAPPWPPALPALPCPLPPHGPGPPSRPLFRLCSTTLRFCVGVSGIHSWGGLCNESVCVSVLFLSAVFPGC
ncbi:hypothetical protein Q7C36_004366 [Tachysurus vachellii]|uniref:Uncharacterized protein n=1 Tax=Tachysurus vachellii TaxID=175792 RepID=A0AA88NN96_TACVA|nr:hypothetical protein Q7C36_004366 [Tachysurus vachellii]